ncbi:MAG: hypothetical protein IT382_15790 [Deltaproteobacteria bacterium]|nr:hypothetical protein [Deltaproteobacteria bacterium]
MDDARQLAIRLLSENRTRIARGIRRLGARLEPKFENIPAEVSEASIAGFLRDLEHFLRSNDAGPLASTVRATVRLRRVVGFTAADFAVFSHAYLPVIRRVFVQAAELPLPALRAFDDVENVLLPVMARLLADFALAGLVDPEAEGDDTAPSLAAPSTGKNVNPFAYLSVDEELTDPGRGPPIKR